MASMITGDTGSAKARFEKLKSDRAQFLQRARHNALLTIPSLMPLDGHDGRAHLVEPYQGLGARGVVHLSSRMLVGFLPAGRPYLRLDLPPQQKLELAGEIDTTVTKGLALSETLVQSEIEEAGWRSTTLQTLQQLMVAGNVVEHILPDNRIRLYRLDQYVCRRAYNGTLLELVICEKFPASALPPDVTRPAGKDDEEQVELFTWVTREKRGGREVFKRVQEWGAGAQIGKVAYFEIDRLPYAALRWSATPGEDYGRAKVEEHIADLRSLDALEKAQLEMAAMASRNFIMISPGAGSSSMKNRLVRAINGDVVVGDPNSVELKSFDNAGGYQITAQQVAVLREQLAHAFLLMSVGQRNAERVTATEIERDIQELEAALGGVFSSLNADMMEWRTALLMDQMKVQGKLPNFPAGAIVPIILTGLEALSRERDVTRAVQAAEITRAFLGADQDAGDVVKLDKILGRAFVGLGFPDSVRTEEETAGIRQQRAEQQQQQQMMEQAGPLIQQAMKQEGGNG